MRAKYFIAALMVAQTPMAAASKSVQTLSPSSPWNLRYDEDKCRMLRSFATAERKVTLMLDQSGIEPYYTLTLVGSGVEPNNAQYMTVKFGDEEETKRSFIKGRLEDKTPLITMYGVNLAPLPPLESNNLEGAVEPIGANREAALERIVFSGGLDDPLVLQTGSLGEPLAAMRECANDLVQHLGLDGAAKLGLSRHATPKGSAGDWVTDEDYPSAMIQRDEEGLVRFRLTVDSTGRPTACHIARSTRPQVFDDIVCLALIKRARFTPALDQEGKPVAAYYHNTVRFQIPD